MKMLLKGEKFKKAFSLLGNSWEVNGSLLEVRESLTNGLSVKCIGILQ